MILRIGACLVNWAVGGAGAGDREAIQWSAVMPAVGALPSMALSLQNR